MTPYSLGYVIGQLLVLLAFALPAIFFLVSQQRTLQVIRPELRELRPGLVWLQLIPLFNWYWMFVVVTRIADSISKEMVARQDDSILGIPDFDAVQAVSNRPTYKIGMAYCFLYLGCFLSMVAINLTVNSSDMLNAAFGGVLILLLLGAFCCWIIYWVKLAQNRRKLERY
jgi:hypothetical protein